MTKPALIRPHEDPAEQGYTLVAVMFVLTILVISLTVAVPRIARTIQRDRELETMQRGKQYTRAIQLYFRKFGAYPMNVDALVNTNEMRFLRKRYLDPMTGKDDWQPIQVGQNKTPLAMGFFGQPLMATGSPFPGTAPVGTGSNPGASAPGGGFGSSQSGDSALGSASNPCSGSDSAGAPAGTEPDGGSDSASGASPSGQPLGGAGIIGFSPCSPRQSILSYKAQNHYNEWEFLYSPQSDRMATPGNPIAQPPLQWGAPGLPPQPLASPAPEPVPPQ